MQDGVRPDLDVAVIGGGQAGLAMGYHLRRAGFEPWEQYAVLDAGREPGGAWREMWDGLRLFSPAAHSSLPGWQMPPWPESEGYPPRQHVVDYLTAYEKRYALPVRRPCQVTAVTREPDPGDPARTAALRLHTDNGDQLTARVVVSATGTWQRPFWPAYPGMADFRGRQRHASDYRSPADLEGRRVGIVGGGNSAAQILAEVSRVAETSWFTQHPPRFLPDDVDGRDLFAAATARIQALREGRTHAGVAGLGDIVMVADVREARERGVLEAQPMFTRLTARGVLRAEGEEQELDELIWCTGFRPALQHLHPLHLRDHAGRIPTGGPSGTRARDEPRLYLVGYGDWTGPASATLIGVGRTARDTVADLEQALDRHPEA